MPGSIPGSCIWSESVVDGLVDRRPEIAHQLRHAKRAGKDLRHQDADEILSRIDVPRIAESAVPSETPWCSSDVVAPGHDREPESPAARVPEAFEKRRRRLLLGRELIRGHG